MTTQYKSGTIARVHVAREDVIAIRGRDFPKDHAYGEREPGWYVVHKDGSSGFWSDYGFTSGAVTNIRPLVVPEVLTELEARKIIGALREPGTTASGAAAREHLARAIESQIQPPKPEESREFGAKIIARLPGHHSLRRLLRIAGTPHSWQTEAGARFKWDELSDVTLGWGD